MASQYYCLIAGLDEYSFTDKNRQIELAELRAEITEQLSAGDRKTLGMLYAYYDIQNFVNFLQNSSLPFNTLGNLTHAQIEQEVAAEEVDEEPYQSLVPLNIRMTLDRYAGKNLDDEQEPISKERIEQQLYSDFYATCATSKCGFIKRWCEIDRAIRNIITAHRGAELGIDTNQMMIGAAIDEREFEYYTELMAVLDTRDFVERETKMDALRWQIAEELAEHNYFDIAAVLAYLVKLNILYRWSALDKQAGEKRFRTIVESFTANTHIE